MSRTHKSNLSLKILLFLGSLGVIVIGSALFLLTAGRGIGQYFFGKSFAENQLKGYVSSVLRQEVNGAHCQAVDSDGNGYVSCDYTLAGSPQTTHSIECAAWGLNGILNRGCKARLPGFNN